MEISLPNQNNQEKIFKKYGINGKSFKDLYHYVRANCHYKKYDYLKNNCSHVGKELIFYLKPDVEGRDID